MSTSIADPAKFHAQRSRLHASQGGRGCRDHRPRGCACSQVWNMRCRLPDSLPLSPSPPLLSISLNTCNIAHICLTACSSTRIYTQYMYTRILINCYQPCYTHTHVHTFAHTWKATTTASLVARPVIKINSFKLSPQWPNGVSRELKPPIYPSLPTTWSGVFCKTYGRVGRAWSRLVRWLVLCFLGFPEVP